MVNPAILFIGRAWKISSQFQILTTLGLNRIFEVTSYKPTLRFDRKNPQLPPWSSARLTIYFQSSKHVWVVIDVDVLQTEYKCQKILKLFKFCISIEKCIHSFSSP